MEQPMTYMSLEALAGRLGLPQRFLREAARAGQIPSLCIGGRLRFCEADVRDALRREAARQAAGMDADHAR
jgi:excisionase family DNA binding protein